MLFKSWPVLLHGFATLLGLCCLATAPAHAQTDVNVSIGGIIKPGVYGRVEVGTRPPPPIIYPQPVIITRPVVVAQPTIVVQQQPIYMHVPSGHAKKWSKHCYKYNACNQPVYFVRNEYSGYYEEGHGKHKNKHKKHKHDD
jgi:hypothetical protein